jgi:hypothetical protein
LLASVDVISKEEVVCLGRKAAVLEEAEEIIVLAVNITADLRDVSQGPSLYFSRAVAQFAYLDGSF